MQLDKGQILLLISATGLLPIALSYGVSPNTSLGYLFNIDVSNVNGTHIYRAVMGLYLANLLFWLGGVWSSKLRQFALVTLSVFMLGLAGGRLLSFAIDGIPHWLLALYFFLEAVIGLVALLVLTKGHSRRWTR